MKIPFSQLRLIKELNLPKIIQSYHIELKQKPYNNQYVGTCPFHDDKNPSLHVSFKNNKWLWHCFGCHASGNTLDFVIKKENISFIAAYRKLSKFVGQPIAKSEVIRNRIKDMGSTGSPQVEKPSVINKSELLMKVADYYHNTFKENNRGVEYLKQRGIMNPDIYRDYKIGFVDGSMRNTLNPETVQQLQQIGILNEKGNETFYKCVIFPIFDDDGNVVSLYGRNIERQSHLYLAGKHEGVFNGQVLKTNKSIILTESIIDCVSLIQLGITNTVPLYGTNGLTPAHLQLFRKHMTKEIHLCLDNDESGQMVAKRLVKELEALGISTTNIKLPDVKDINEYVVSGRVKKDFECLVNNIQVIKEMEKKPKVVSLRFLDKEPQVTEDNEQLHFNFAKRQYRLRGFNVNRLDQLRVNIKVVGGDSHHLDTLDLYNARARENFITQAKRSLSLENGHIHRDLTFIVDHLEKLQSNHLERDNDPQGSQCLEIAEHDRNEAIIFLKSNNLFDQILNDFKDCGHVGEENNLLLGYLAGVSRKLATPLAVLVVSRSASGKTTLQDAILSFTPPEDYEKYTRLTDQALFYKGEDSLKHKLLAIEEEKGANGCAYSLRNLQSAQGLSIATTSKDTMTGKLKTEVYKVQGPTAIMITTTASEEVDFETYNRFIILTVDESVNQTKKILEQQRLNESIEGIMAKRNREKIQARHHNAQRLLKTLEVANPYSSQLTFIDTILRARREQPKYLALIKTIALLRQYQKELKAVEGVEYIEVDLKDIEIANKIANEILGRNLDELCPPARNLLIEIKRMVEAVAEREGIKEQDVQFNRRDVREFTRWSDYQIRCHIKQLEELEYLYPVNGGPGKKYSYKLLWEGQGVDGHKFLIGLIDVGRIRGYQRIH